MKVYGLAIKNELCWGCRTCEVACKQENRSAEGTRLISVLEDGPKRVDGQLYFAYQVNVCKHCDEPPCADACPDEAIAKRHDGIVVMDYDSCTGCGLCIDACPYDAIALDEGKGVAQKCNLCHHRVDQGLMPACADNICLAHCIQFVCT
ncbi:MAG: 4Fe-4S binding protein [Desulfobacterales bacterium]|jgi:Fe-S-cluster-containing dehydrogenase component